MEHVGRAGRRRPGSRRTSRPAASTRVVSCRSLGWGLGLGGLPAMVPHDDGHGNVCDGPERPPRIIAADAARDRYREHEHDDRPAAQRRARRHAACCHDPRATADEVEFMLDGLLRLDDASFGDVDAIACASVVPALTAAHRDGRGAPRAAADRRDGRDRAARRADGATRRGRGRPARQRPGRGPALRHARPSWSTSGPRRRSTAWPPTARTSAARSRPGWSWGSRRSRRGPPSCRGSSFAPRTARSAATP